MAERDVRYVVIHTRGSAWRPDLPFAEQAGIQDHIEHYRGMLENGILALGGPFLDNTGGMMIATRSVSSKELVQYAGQDPAVQSGVLRFEVRPWLIAMRGNE